MESVARGVPVEKTQGISLAFTSNQLKFLAIGAMVLDHCAVVWVPDSAGIYPLLRMLGKADRPHYVLSGGRGLSSHLRSCAVYGPAAGDGRRLPAAVCPVLWISSLAGMAGCQCHVVPADGAVRPDSLGKASGFLFGKRRGSWGCAACWPILPTGTISPSYSFSSSGFFGREKPPGDSTSGDRMSLCGPGFSLWLESDFAIGRVFIHSTVVAV